MLAWSLPVRIPDSFEDLTTWDKLRKRFEILEGLSEGERRGLYEAIESLESDLGAGFPGNAVARRHPLVLGFLNRTPLTLRWIIWLAGAVRQSRGWGGYEGLLGRLRHPGKFDEGLSVLEIAHRFSCAGFEIMIDPSVEVKGRRKVPDLKILGDGSELFVEISIQYQSDAARDARYAAEVMFSSLMSAPPFLHFSGHLFDNLGSQSLSELQEEVRCFIQASKRDDRFQEFLVEGVLELAVAPDHARDALQDWADSRGLEVDGFSGPAYANDEIRRTKMKTLKELKQLPVASANILVVENSNLFLHATDIEEVACELEEELHRHPHLLLLVLCGKRLGGGENTVVKKGPHLFSQRLKYGILLEQHLLLRNHSCESEVSAATFEKLQAAFCEY
ncbi:MAG: hypothetical protein JW993_17635 [Sedimentisphaerales bacterium]|nr:hypothetical protein [Sedimentisphaerales bacterium]